MSEAIVNAISQQMSFFLDGSQLKQLQTVLRLNLIEQPSCMSEGGLDLLNLFLTAKEVEGCSPRTIAYYESTIEKMRSKLDKPYTQLTTDDLRKYLSDYERTNGSSKVTIDNIRRIFSSFFSWLEDEDYIVKSPARRIHHVKAPQLVKEVLTDEDLEALRDGCECERDLAIVDMLASTGMRIGELVKLNRDDLNLAERECIVLGKGNKQRPVYFDARTKLHLKNYLASRTDSNPALFVGLYGERKRMTIGGIESRLRLLGRRLLLQRIHPHKFRRTLATNAIDKGMPIEQVQKLLGHARIDTTMHYALVKQSNVKASHRRYLERVHYASEISVRTETKLLLPL